MGVRDIFRRPEEAPSRRAAIVAAGKPIELSDEKLLRRLQRRDQSWQREAWTSFYEIGVIKYALGTVLADAISQVNVFVAAQPDPREEPVPVIELDEGERPDGWKDAVEDLERIRENAAGGLPGILSESSVNSSVPGEFFMTGTDLLGIDETWDVRSIDEVSIKSDRRVDILDEDGANRTLTDDDFFGRIWRRDPRKSFLADSNMRGVGRDCRKLLVLSAHEESAIRSRMSAPVVMFPRSISHGPADPTMAVVDGEEREEPTLDVIVRHYTEPTEDDGSPNAVAPLVLLMDNEDIEAARILQVDRPLLDPEGAMAERILVNIGRGLNIPLDKFTGSVADLNHWNLFGLEENFQALTRPHAIHIVMGFTSAYARPALEARGMSKSDAGKLMWWFDASPIILKPNRSKDFTEGHKDFVISDEARRRVIGANDEDAPDDAEIERRIKIQQAIRSRPESEAPVGETRDAPEQPDEAGLVAAAAVDLGRKLAAIDRSLLDRLQLLSDAALRDALKLAGSRLKNKAQKQFRGLLNGVPSEQVIDKLGPARIEQLGVEENELLADSFDGFQSRYDTAVQRGQDAAVTASGLPVDEETRRAQEEDREAGWAVLLAALLALAGSRLNGTPGAEPQGEFDPDLDVPPSVIRHALSVAGGASGEATAGGAVLVDGRPAGLIGTGERMRSLLASKLGATFGASRWDYGDPLSRGSVFEPHYRLDGVEFTNPQDERLRSYTPWLGGWYSAGDHSGCRCIMVPVISIPVERAA